jgi:hypothetical protein
VDTPVFRPGRKRRFTSPEISVLSDSVFVCPGTDCTPPPPSRRCCGITAATPGTCGNLAVEQHSHWHPGRRNAPGYLEQCRQLTQARAENPWLAAGSQTVQQQTLRDFARAMTAFVDPANPAGRPSWRKASGEGGFQS